MMKKKLVVWNSDAINTSHEGEIVQPEIREGKGADNTKNEGGETAVTQQRRSTDNTRNSVDVKTDSSVNELKTLCWFGKRCQRSRCNFIHSDVSIPPKCHYGLRCNKNECLFSHKNDCSKRFDCDMEGCEKRHYKEKQTQKMQMKNNENESHSNERQTNANNRPTEYVSLYDRSQGLSDQKRYDPWYGSLNQQPKIANLSYRYEYNNQTYYPNQNIYPVKRLTQAKNVLCR